MKSIFELRNHMANKGIELTVDQTTDLCNSLTKLKRKLNKVSDISQMTLDEKQNLMREAANQGIEISPKEFKVIHEIMIAIQEA